MEIAFGLMIIIAGGILIAFIIKAIFTSIIGRWFAVLFIGLFIYYFAHIERKELEARHIQQQQQMDLETRYPGFTRQQRGE